MPIVAQSNFPMTTTAGDIVDCVSQDVRAVLDNTDPDLQILLDYVNRITNELLRFSRWQFTTAETQVFLTTPGITDYWIGVGDPPSGCVDTQLALEDVFTIKQGEFIDRTQQKRLAKTGAPPIGQQFSGPGRPALWRNASATPYVINIYPPPNQNSFQFVPSACITTAESGGALSVRTYYLKVTFGDNCGGESAGSIEQVVVVPASQLLTVASPVLPLTTDAVTLLTTTGPTIDRWNIYATSASAGAETLQLANIAMGTDWTEDASGLTTSGAAVPTSNTLAELGGYIMEFQYFQTRQTIDDVDTIIQIPDTYKDIVCAGTNWLAFKYLEMDTNAQIWKSVFDAGKSQMVKDANLFPRGEEFIRPDSAAVSRQATTGLGLDSGIETSLP